MSNIDQAFINAYSETSSARAAASPRDEAPELRIFAHAVQRGLQDVRADRVEQSRHPRPHFDEARTPVYATPGPKEVPLDEDSDEIVLPSLIGERRPLSSFAKPKHESETHFKPLFEVDEFQWPLVTHHLIRSARELMLPIVDSIASAIREGRSLVGIAATDCGAGASTVAMCVARLMAERGTTLALVDANFVEGNLGATLGLEFDAGWEGVLIGDHPLPECAVYSLGDKITLIPLGGPCEEQSKRLSSIQSSVIAGMLRYHHELVLFDLGSASDVRQFSIMRDAVRNCRLDAGIIVAPSGQRDLGTLHAIEQLTKLFGPNCLGVIGNKAS